LNTFTLDPSILSQVAQSTENETPTHIIERALQQVPNTVLACSFGAEDMVLLDMLMKISPEVSVFYLDTDVLFQETYDLIDISVKKYGIPNLIRVTSEYTLPQQKDAFGDELWKSNPNQCCDLRKVQPLNQILSKFEGWITGIRRDQAPTRANAQTFEADAKFGLVKVNPLVRWTMDDVWAYIRQNDVPYNPLHEQGYPSIGCFHCTLPVKPGEDPRSGRWAGLEKNECGLHK